MAKKDEAKAHIELLEGAIVRAKENVKWWEQALKKARQNYERRKP